VHAQDRQPRPEPYTAKLKAPFGVLGLRTDSRAITTLAYLPHAEPALAPRDAVAEKAVRELESYLRDPDFRFSVPLAPGGTPFQQRVWAALGQIPLGHSRTYGEVARLVRSAPRAVGQACGANRIALIIPCHRVVGAMGSLGGFMNAENGHPLAIKRWLLQHEGYRFGA
jgi:methylated-DNA-[protein]-cysteine S-methyltransferase